MEGVLCAQVKRVFGLRSDHCPTAYTGKTSSVTKTCINLPCKLQVLKTSRTKDFRGSKAWNMYFALQIWVTDQRCSQEETPISVRRETHALVCKEQNIQQRDLYETPVWLRREIYMMASEVKSARLQAQEKVPVTVRPETHCLSCKVRSVQHYASLESSGSVKHKICTVAYVLQNVQSCAQNGTNWHTCCVLRDEGYQDTVWSAKRVEWTSQFVFESSEYQTVYERKFFIVKRLEVALVLGCC